MLGISYLKSLPERIRLWQRFKLFPKSVQQSGRVPSETYVKYPPDSKFNGASVLNLGCGRSVYKIHNVCNLDAVSGDGVDVVHDLSKMPLQLESNQFDLIIANHVLEHIPNWWECFKELARVCKPGGIIEVWIPPASSDSAYTYRDHINRIGLLSFAGTKSFRNAGTNILVQTENDKEEDVAKMALIATKQRTIVKWWITFAPDSLVEWMSNHLRNVVSEEGFIFRKMP